MTVSELLTSLRTRDPERHALVEAVRTVVRATLPDVTEEVKYGGILFASAGEPFSGVFAYKGHVSVEFSDGAHIDDPYGHLQGKGKGRRHLKLHEAGDIAEQMLAAYLPLALQATREGADSSS